METFAWHDVLSIRAEWRLREESAEACATRLGRMLQGLEMLHGGFPLLIWTRGPMRPLYPLPACLEELAPLLQPKRIYDEARKRRLPDWFSFTADARWGDKRFIRIRISSGSHIGCAEQLAWPNLVSIATVIHDRQNADRDILQAMKPALAAVVDAWQPERAGAFSQNFRVRRHDPARPSFYNGAWAAYLDARAAQNVTMPQGATTEPLAAGGCLLLVTDSVFDEADPVQRQVGAAIQETLAAAS
jgi:hypothetical protein